MPALEWEPCAWKEGCANVKVTWEYVGARPWVMPSVVARGGGFFIGALVPLKQNGEFWPHTVIYDATGKPVMVWRIADPKTNCALSAPLLTASRVWVSASDVDNGLLTRYLVAGYDELLTKDTVLPMTQTKQEMVANDDTLMFWGLGGNPLIIYDRLSGVATDFGGAAYPSYTWGKPLGDSALLRCYFAPEQPNGCIWKRSTNTIKPFIQPGNGEIVPLLATDGQTLVWVQTSPGNETWPAGWFYTSPFVTEAQNIVPTKRRPSPEMGLSELNAAEGFMAFSNGASTAIHVYRLSDMHHWSFSAPDVAAYGIPHIDKGEVWYDAVKTLARQQISALGPGDPAP